MCYSFDFLGPEKLSAGKVRSILETFGKVAQRRLVVLGAVQPRRGAPRHALGQGRAGQAGLSEGDLGAADVAARLGLHLPGRGARPRRGRAALRGSAGSLRHPLLAGIQGPRRLPHADGVGEGGSRMPAFPAASPGCRSRPTMRGRRSTRRQGDPSLDARALSPLPGVPPLLSGLRQGRHRVPGGRRRHARLHARVQGNEQIVCAFNLGARSRL